MSKLNLVIGALGVVSTAASIVVGVLQDKVEDQKIQQAVAEALANQGKEA